jgi:hypothetical protein
MLQREVKVIDRKYFVVRSVDQEQTCAIRFVEGAV